MIFAIGKRRTEFTVPLDVPVRWGFWKMGSPFSRKLRARVFRRGAAPRREFEISPHSPSPQTNGLDQAKEKNSNWVILPSDGRSRNLVRQRVSFNFVYHFCQFLDMGKREENVHSPPWGPSSLWMRGNIGHNPPHVPGGLDMPA